MKQKELFEKMKEMGWDKIGWGFIFPTTSGPVISWREIDNVNAALSEGLAENSGEAIIKREYVLFDDGRNAQIFAPATPEIEQEVKKIAKHLAACSR